MGNDVTFSSSSFNLFLKLSIPSPLITPEMEMGHRIVTYFNVRCVMCICVTPPNFLSRETIFKEYNTMIERMCRIDFDYETATPQPSRDLTEWDASIYILIDSGPLA